MVGKALDKAIRSIAATGHARCAVAFLGDSADTIFTGGKALIVCNLMSGSTNPATVRKLQEQGHEVRQNDRLHAKVYVGAGKALIASANLSTNGLGLQNSELARWIEAGAYTDEVAKVLSWFENLWNDSPETRPIDPSDLQIAEDLWRERQSVKPMLEFGDYDVYSDNTPLISWWWQHDYKIHPSYSNRKQTGRPDIDVDAFDDFYPIDAPVDTELLAPGTWLLWWKMNRNGRPSSRTKCSWFRAGRSVEKCVKFTDSRRWVGAVLAHSTTRSEPFSCDNQLFNEVFRVVIMRDQFSRLRETEYSGSFLEPRIAQMRLFWPALQRAYREALPAQREGNVDRY